MNGIPPRPLETVLLWSPHDDDDGAPAPALNAADVADVAGWACQCR